MLAVLQNPKVIHAAPFGFDFFIVVLGTRRGQRQSHLAGFSQKQQERFAVGQKITRFLDHHLCDIAEYQRHGQLFTDLAQTVISRIFGHRGVHFLLHFFYLENKLVLFILQFFDLDLIDKNFILFLAPEPIEDEVNAYEKKMEK